jgi:hypothetical protein
MGLMNKTSSAGPESNPNAIRPYGRFGVGTITGHPVGLLIVAAVILLSLEGLPEARAFLVASLPVGFLFGLFLWLRHR